MSFKTFLYSLDYFLECICKKISMYHKTFKRNTGTSVVSYAVMTSFASDSRIKEDL